MRSNLPMLEAIARQLGPLLRVEYHRLGDRLPSLDFREDMNPGAPICRWRSDVGVLDVMPTDEAILGFSNPWYDRAMETSEWRGIAADGHIRLVSPPMFLATKLAAFEGRGEADLVASHDIEDILAVVAYRARGPRGQALPSLLPQILHRPPDGSSMQARYMGTAPNAAYIRTRSVCK